MFGRITGEDDAEKIERLNCGILRCCITWLRNDFYKKSEVLSYSWRLTHAPGSCTKMCRWPSPTPFENTTDNFCVARSFVAAA